MAPWGGLGTEHGDREGLAAGRRGRGCAGLLCGCLGCCARCRFGPDGSGQPGVAVHRRQPAAPPWLPAPPGGGDRRDLLGAGKGGPHVTAALVPHPGRSTCACWGCAFADAVHSNGLATESAAVAGERWWQWDSAGDTQVGKSLGQPNWSARSWAVLGLLLRRQLVRAPSRSSWMFSFFRGFPAGSAQMLCSELEALLWAGDAPPPRQTGTPNALLPGSHAVQSRGSPGCSRAWERLEPSLGGAGAASPAPVPPLAAPALGPLDSEVGEHPTCRLISHIHHGFKRRGSSAQGLRRAERFQLHPFPNAVEAGRAQGTGLAALGSPTVPLGLGLSLEARPTQPLP